MLHPLLATARHRGLQSGRLPRISDPRMKSRLKLKHKGKQKAVPVPKEWQNRRVTPEKGPSVYLSRLLPHEGISQAITSPTPRMAILGHKHSHHSGLLIS